MSESNFSILNDINTRRDLFVHYYDNFEKHLYSDKLSKASEFLWGALASLIQAIGLAYGKKLSNHQKILDFSKEISETENDSSIYSAVQEGEQLHANFYHNFMTKENLIFKRKYIDRLIEKLSLILEKRLKLLEKTFVEESDFESALNLE